MITIQFGHDWPLIFTIFGNDVSCVGFLAPRIDPETSAADYYFSLLKDGVDRDLALEQTVQLYPGFGP